MSSKSLIAIGLLCAALQVLAQPPPPAFGPAASFAVLASTVTSSGPTVVTGNLGGNTITGFPPGTVILGTTLRHGDIAEPLRDAAAVYEDLRTRTCDQALPADLVPKHVYCSAASFTLQGTLTLDAHGDPNAFWIFQLGNGLTVAPKSAVRVINGGWEGNVFWQVNGQAAIGDDTAFIGNILASKGITFGPGASLSGRALALGGAATLSGNNISLCCKLIEVSNPANSAAVANAAFSETFTQKNAAAPLTFALASGTLPKGFSLAANGTLSGTTAELGTFPITVRVTDATHCNGTSATYVLTVGCAPITITNPANDHGVVDVPFSETFMQTGVAAPAVFTPVSTLPTWLTLDSSGKLHGVSTQTGTFTIRVKVTGANGCFLIDPIDYVLIIDCQTITVTNPANNAGTAGVMFSVQFGQMGAIGTATFTLDSGALPPNLALSSRGLLSGITNQAGPISITVKVTDANNCTATSARYNAVINCQTIIVVPPVTTAGTTGTPFCEAFTATGVLGTPTFSSSGALPAGIAFTNDGMLCGTPTQIGCFPITVTVTDTNGCTDSAAYTLCISSGGGPPPCPPIVGSPAILSPAVNAVAYLQTITPSGGTAPYTFAVIGGALPAGLTLNAATGTVSGIPTVSADFDVVVRITDATGCSGIVFYYPGTIPAISEWGLCALAFLLGLLGIGLIRKGTT